MSYSVPASTVIDYLPRAMAAFPIYVVEWIDNLHFILPPDRTRVLFLQAGWEGKGEVGLL